MFKNYLRVAIRNLTKHRFYSLLNIVGLSVGLCSFILITQYVRDELSYDHYQSDLDNIYRMDFYGKINGNEFNTALASPPTAKVMIADFPEVVDATRFRGTGTWFIKKQNSEQSFKEEQAIFADKNFFTFFDVPLIYGERKNTLAKPNTIAISKSLSQKVFGDVNPVGETVILDNESQYTVAGVFEDIPTNSHFHFNMLITMENNEESKMNIWLSFNFNTYLKLAPGADPAALQSKFPDLITKYIGPEIEQMMGMDLDKFAESGNQAAFSLFPMQDIHLKSDKLGDMEANGDMNYVYLFSAIALFILILACINFMNLSTARSANRAKEVGVRKVMGAYKSHLINQFLSEAFLISLISTVIAIVLAVMLLPMFNELANKEILVSSFINPLFIGGAIVIAMIVGLLAGSYPAFYLSAFKPVSVLKGKLNMGTKSSGIRSTLVVLQFTVSIAMIIGTAIVYDQLSFIQNKKLGYEKDQVIMIQDAWLLGDNVQSFKNELVNHTDISSGTVATFLPVGTTNNNNAWFPGSAPSNDTYIFHNYRVDHDYVKTLGMEIVEGRDFSKEFLSDSSAVLVNESLVKKLGFENPIGEKLSTYGGPREQPIVLTYKIIGVVKDFHYVSLRNNIDPLVFQLGNRTGFISFSLNTEDVAGAINLIESKWMNLHQDNHFLIHF